jgi:hypothetical protein
MLVWINGPFGVGKTATAYELCRRLPGSVVCNPDHVGFGMRRMLPPTLRGNFQDLPVWRHSVAYLLRLTLTGYPGPVIVPDDARQPRLCRGDRRRPARRRLRRAPLHAAGRVGHGTQTAEPAQPGHREQAGELGGQACSATSSSG